MSFDEPRKPLSMDGFAVDELKLLLDVSRQLGAPIALRPLLDYIEQAALTVLSCERATVFLYDAQRDELRSQVATGVEELRFPATSGIAGHVAKTGEIINVPDAYADDRFNRDIDKQTGFRTRNLLTVPLSGQDGSRVGVLQVLNKTGGPFVRHDEALAETLSTVAGVALHRQILLDEFAEKQRLQHELGVAREIQQAQLPTEQPTLAGYDIAGWNRPATETGGDCFSFIPMPDGRLGLMLADATGHGIGPALMVAEWRALTRAMVHLCDDVATITQHVNDVLREDLPPDRFVTALFGFLEPKSGRLDYIAAGQGPLLHYHASDDSVEAINATTFPLGIIEDAEFGPTAIIALAPGDMLLLATDGFYEWHNGGREEFGSARVSDVIREHRPKPAAEIITALQQAVEAFGGDVAQEDDLTAILIKRL